MLLNAPRQFRNVVNDVPYSPLALTDDCWNITENYQCATVLNNIFSAHFSAQSPLISLLPVTSNDHSMDRICVDFDAVSNILAFWQYPRQAVSTI